MNASGVFQLNEALALLERTPVTLDRLLRGLPDHWITATEGPETWSPFDVVGHLIHGERTDWITRARQILDRGPDVVFEPFDRQAMFEASRGKTLADLLDEFAALRRENVRALQRQHLTNVDLARRGRHPALGTVTLRQLLATWVAHDLSHLGQIVRVMAKRYGDDVGPWKAYLPLLTR